MNINNFPAHINKNKEIQTLDKHLLNVANLTSDYLKPINFESLGFLVGILHDLGKATESFKNYIIKTNNGLYIKKLDHSCMGAIYVYYKGKEENTIESIILAEICSVAIMSHHSGLPDIITINGTSPFLERINKINKNDYKFLYKEAVSNTEDWLVKKNLDDIVKKAINEIRFFLLTVKKSKIDIFYAITFLTKIVYSALIDADRIDAASFEDNEQLGLNIDRNIVWNDFARKIEERIKKFDDDNAINKCRLALSNNCYKNANLQTGVYTLESPTGSGKTISSLRFSVNHNLAQKKERIIYIAPYINVIDQTAEEFRKTLQIDNKSLMIAEIHSEMNDIEDDFNFFSKRYENPIVLMSMVRFMDSCFGNSSSNIRGLHHFINSTIIFDEIQCLDIKYSTLIAEMIKFLTNICKTTILLSTATQAKYINQKIFKDTNKIDVSECTDSIRNYFKSARIINLVRPEGYSLNDLNNFIEKEFSNINNILITVNTRKTVNKIYDYLIETAPKDIKILAMSKNQFPKHRKQIIKEIKQLILRCEKFILVSTQLLDCGINLDFDSIIRSWTGLDRIIQIKGRCNRENKRNFGNVYVMNFDFEHTEKINWIETEKHSFERFLVGKPCVLDENELEEYYKILQLYVGKDYEDYPCRIDNIETTMCDLLSKNTKSYHTLLHNHKELIGKIVMRCSFKSAAKEFKAIDSNEISVVVKTSDSLKLYSKLKETDSIQEKLKILNELEQYTVNIHKHLFEKAKSIIEEDEETGVYLISNKYYDESIGLFID